MDERDEAVVAAQVAYWRREKALKDALNAWLAEWFAAGLTERDALEALWRRYAEEYARHEAADA